MIRLLQRCYCLVLVLLAGCNGTSISDLPPLTLDYGVTPPPHDSTVVLEDFSYTPASPIHVGDKLHFTARSNKPTSTAAMWAYVGEPLELYAYMHDDGLLPDDVEGDGVWHGEYSWAPSMGRIGPAQPVWVELQWLDGAPGQQLAAPPLTVLPAEEDAP